MEMAPQGQTELEHDHQPNSSHTSTDYGAGNYATHLAFLSFLRAAMALAIISQDAVPVAVFMTFKVIALALVVTLEYAVLYHLGRCHRGRVGDDPENPAVEEAEAECTICLNKFAGGDDAVRVMPACRHSFHERCIQRLSCPTCHGPAAVATTAAAAAAQPEEATNRREPYSCTGIHRQRFVFVAYVTITGLQTTALAFIVVYRFLQGK